MLETNTKGKTNFQKSKVLSVALILLLTLSALAIVIPTASAATVTIETTAYCYATPNPVGVDQMLIVTYRIDKLSPTAMGTSRGDRFIMSVAITDPAGKVTTKTGLITDATSSGWFLYYPKTQGTYKFQSFFATTNITSGSTISNFLASESTVTEITVQTDPIPPYPDNPLPDGYWTRPIYGENKGWNVLSSDWLMQGFNYMSVQFGSASSAYAPLTAAPNTAHLLWTLPILPGGVVGGKYGDQIYYEGLSYEQHYNPLIWNGRIIFTEHDLSTTTIYQTRCIDLYTGEDIFILPNITIAFAQVVMTTNPNEHGGVPYLVATGGSGSNATWQFFDAWTGRRVFNLINFTWGGAGGYNVPTRFGPAGEVLSIYFNSTAKTMSLWNSTKAIYRPGSIDTWGPTFGSNVDGSIGVEWTVSVPDLLTGMSTWDVNFDEGWVLVSKSNSSTTPYVYTQQGWDISGMKKDSSGAYPTTLRATFTKDRLNIWLSYFLMSNVASGVYAMFDESQCVYHTYSMRTGEELWASDPITDAWASFDWEWFIAYGLLFASGYDGYLRAYNATTGAVVWKQYFGSAGYENAYGTYPVYSGFRIADGKIYVTADEHSPDSIPWRGGKLWCYNAYTGEPVWNISGKLRNGAISSGYYTTLNSLDGQVYTFGKGPSKTTVIGPQVAVPKGTGVMLTGTVTDQSPGAKDTPAIADSNMTAWMQYIYEQAAFPCNGKDTIVGVPVTLSAIDPSGTPITIGTTTSDFSGAFGFLWNPDMEGTYQVTATFGGSQSYGASFAMTYVGVGPAQTAPTAAPTTAAPTTAAPTTAAPTTAAPSTTAPEPGNNTMTYVYVAIAAVLIIVVVLAAAITLRRRK